MIPEGVDEASGVDFPEFDRFVSASRSLHLPVGAEGHGLDPFGVPFKGRELRPLPTSQSLSVWS